LGIFDGDPDIDTDFDNAHDKARDKAWVLTTETFDL
jgi:hypothetical protein